MSDGSAAPGPAAVTAMYQEALLAHYRAPRNRRAVEDATASAAHRNPMCGDEISVEVRVRNGTVDDVAFRGQGCSIAVASASMMTEAVRGLSTSDALHVADGIGAMLAGGSTLLLPEGLAPLRAVARFPARHGCANMPWMALREAIASES